jgi:hypothetical protein
VWASDLANNNQEDNPDMYQYQATDHKGDTADSGTDNSLFVLQFSRAPKDINWANLIIQIIDEDAHPYTCAIGAGDGNCLLVQYGNDNLTWEKAEIIHVVENGKQICTADPCELSIKISDASSGVDLTGDSSVVVH